MTSEVHRLVGPLIRIFLSLDTGGKEKGTFILPEETFAE